MKCVDIEKLVHSAYRDELPNQSVAFGVGERLQSTLLAAIAEFERELIRERVMANGVKFGRKPDPSPHPAQRLGLAALGGSTICP
jgi:DNA invertase Pin-like site-specific DNA recombinase